MHLKRKVARKWRKGNSGRTRHTFAKTENTHLIAAYTVEIVASLAQQKNLFERQMMKYF